MPTPIESTDWSAEFPVLEHLAFLNHAGVAPLSKRAADALRGYAAQAESSAYVGHGWYDSANRVKADAARLIGAAGPQEIAFIPNTSTGLALVAKGVDWREGDNVVITDVEYPANRYPWVDLERFGVEVIEVQQQRDGRVDVEDVCEAITDRTRIVSVSHVQWASGYRIDLRPISDTVHAAGGHLCVDAIQSTGVLPVDVESMGIDFLAADGHKWMLGPEGCGFFYAKEDLAPLLHPNVVGWMNMVDAINWGDYRFQFQMDARRFEPGSMNLAGIFAMGASISLLLEVGIDRVWSRVEALTNRLCDGLAAKGYRVFSPRAEAGERSGIVVFDPPPAPAPGSGRPMPSIKQIVADLQREGVVIVVREGRLRASPHFYNTEAQIDRLVELLP